MTRCQKHRRRAAKGAEGELPASVHVAREAAAHSAVAQRAIAKRRGEAQKRRHAEHRALLASLDDIRKTANALSRAAPAAHEENAQAAGAALSSSPSRSNQAIT